MGKQQKKTSKTSDCAKQSFGRPTNAPLEALFMKKMRSGKLKVITAQSEAEIECQKYLDLKPQTYAKRVLKEGDQNDNYCPQKIVWVRNWFSNYQSVGQDFDILWRAFKQAGEQFEYNEIKSIEDWPQYIFQDQCDLSYVLCKVLNSSIPELRNKRTFSESELFFLEMLSFANRDMIPFRVLQMFQDRFTEILQTLGGLKSRIQLQYETLQVQKPENQGSLKNQKESSLGETQNRQKNKKEKEEKEKVKGNFSKDLPSEQRCKEISERLKTRQIEKPKRNDRKKRKVGRPKVKEEIMEEQISQESLQELITKLVSHIALSYLYIYPEEVKKRQKQSDT